MTLHYVSLSLRLSLSHTLLQLSPRFLITFVHLHQPPSSLSFSRYLVFLLFSFSLPLLFFFIIKGCHNPPAEPPRLFIADGGWRWC